jgi:hypothetical protein
VLTQMIAPHTTTQDLRGVERALAKIIQSW